MFSTRTPTSASTRSATPARSSSARSVRSREPELKVYKGVTLGDVVGQSGLEAQYNQYLQGVNGSEARQGQLRRTSSRATPRARRRPPGDTLKLSINAKLEKVGQTALAESIAAHERRRVARSSRWTRRTARSTRWARRRPTTRARHDDAPGSRQLPHQPGQQLPAARTGDRGRGAGRLDVQGDHRDRGARERRLGSQRHLRRHRQVLLHGPAACCLQNAGGASYGSLDLEQAIQVSDDVFFYNLGDLHERPVTRSGKAIDYPDAWPLQQWANRFGIGRPTGHRPPR